MKRHAFGFCIALLAFFGSFYVSPIRFFNVAIGRGYNLNGSDKCSYLSTKSNHLIRLYASSCDYKTSERAVESVNKNLNEAIDIIEPAEKIKNRADSQRAVFVRRENDSRYFCLVRANENWVTDVCSPSLRHVLEFERQNFDK